jgi:hypothetical protein
VTKRAISAGVLGVLAAASAAALAALAIAAPNQTAAVAQYAPQNTQPPTIDDTTPAEGQTLTASPGTWTGDQPMVFTYQWRRCNAGGNNCVDIPTARNQTYTAQAADRGNTLRVTVTATNASGANSATSAATSAVGAPVPRDPRAATHTAVANVNSPDRLLVDQVVFSPNPIRSRTAPITVRVRVLDTQGRRVSGALVFIRSTPLVTQNAPESATDAEGWATFTVLPERDFSIVFRRGYNLQWFVRARKPGDNPLVGVSTRRLVQVGIRPAS